MTKTQKRCTSCQEEFDLDNFYSKAERLDAICKTCKKEKSKLAYQRNKKVFDLKNLKGFVDLMMELEIKKLTKFEKELCEFIEKAKARTDKTVPIIPESWKQP